MDIPGELITGGAVVLTALAGGSVWLVARGTKDATVAIQAASAEREAVAARQECASLLNRLHVHETTCATLFTRLEGVAQGASQASREAENRMTAAVGDLKRAIESLSERLDRVFQQGVPPQQHAPQGHARHT